MLAALPFSDLQAEMPADTQPRKVQLTRKIPTAKVEFIGHIDHSAVPVESRWKYGIFLSPTLDMAQMVMCMMCQDLVMCFSKNCTVRYCCRISDTDGNVIWETTNGTPV